MQILKCDVLEILRWKISRGGIMQSECVKLKDCPFFLKHGKDLSHKIQGFKNMYCQGPLRETCVRLSYKEVHGEKPCDNLSPAGVILVPPPSSEVSVRDNA